jgi:hypothetical protein
MLHNPNWKNDTKVDPTSLVALIAWLETMNPTKEFDFSNMSKCMLGQWVKYCDPEARADGGQLGSFGYIVHGEAVDFRSNPAFIGAAHGGTFGGALSAANYLKGAGHV